MRAAVTLTLPISPTYPGFTDGDVVTYRGEIWYVDGFMGNNFVRLRDRPRRPDETNAHVPKAVIQSVPVAAATKLPEERLGKTRYHKIKSEADVERAERTRAGRHDVGDEVAEALRGKTIEQVYEYAAPLLKATAAELDAKYAHLDTGRKRMTIGNRLRALKK